MKITKDKKPLDKLYARRNRYDLQPDFQRGEVWSLEKSKKLLDTIYKGWDIPKVYLNVIDDENFEVIDGQQRMSTIFKFYDNLLQLPKDTFNLDGLVYKELDDKSKDKFDDYEMDLVLINEATEEEISELFLRLQLGVPTNTAERLNAIPGKMTSYCKKLMKHNFFEKKIILKNNRLSHFAVIAQIALLVSEGIRSVKSKILTDFFNENKNFEIDSKKGKNIQKIITNVDKIFTYKSEIFRNRALIISFFVLIMTLQDHKLKLTKNTREILRKFYEYFYTKLQSEIEKGSSAKDAELIIFQSKVSQDADSKESIQIRNDILSRNLIFYNNMFRDFLETSELDAEYTKLKVAGTTKTQADKCFELIANLNKIYSTDKGIDIFKITSEVIESFPRLGNLVQHSEDFKLFIDSAYKIFYEGSGTLNRIPDSFKDDNSIFIEIKHLRTDFFHDIEHGNPSAIRNKKQSISKIYTKYCAKKSFNSLTNAEIQQLQSTLLDVLIKALQNIKNAVGNLSSQNQTI